MEKITSEELEEFKNLVSRFAKEDYSSLLPHQVAELLNRNCLPKKVREHEFVIQGSSADNERTRIVLKDDIADIKKNLHEVTAQIDIVTTMGGQELPSYEDRVVRELSSGTTRITSKHGTARIANAVGTGLSDVRRSKEYEFDKDGVLTNYQEKDKDTGITESFLVSDGKVTIHKNHDVYEFETDRLLYSKESVKHIPVDVDLLIKDLEAEKSVSK